jgi:hypothetical protein
MRLNIKDLQEQNVFFASNSELHSYKIVLENIFAGKKPYCVETSRVYCMPPNSKTLEFPRDRQIEAMIPETASPMLVFLLAKRAITFEKVVLLLLFYEKEIILDWFDLIVCPEKIKKSLERRVKNLLHTGHGISVADAKLITFETNRKTNSSLVEEVRTYLSGFNWHDIGVERKNLLETLNTAHKRKRGASKESTIRVERDREGETGYQGEVPISVDVDANNRK